MYVEKLPSGKYRACESYKDPLTGKYKKISITIDKCTKKEQANARIMLDEKIAKLYSKTGHDKMTLGQLADLYLADQEKVNRASTVNRNRYAIKRILELIGRDVLIDKIDAGMVRSAAIKCGEDPGTRNEFYKRFKAFIRWGYENDYIKDINYLSKLKPFKDVKKKEELSMKYLEKREIDELINVMRVEKWNLLTRFLILSGLRIGEAIALQISDVDIKNREIKVTKTYDSVNDILTQNTKTDTSTRDVYIQDELLEVVRIIRSDALAQRMLYGCNYFFQDNGKKIEYYAYCKYLKENSTAIGHRITPHALRHTHVSLLAASGLSLEEISRRVGHADSRITREIYFHVTEELKEKDKERIKNVKIL